MKYVRLLPIVTGVTVLRLTQKGVLRSEDSAEGKRYYPEINEDTTRRNETKNFMERIYNGSLRMMVSNLVKDSKLSASEVKELMNLVDKMEQ